MKSTFGGVRFESVKDGSYSFIHPLECSGSPCGRTDGIGESIMEPLGSGHLTLNVSTLQSTQRCVAEVFLSYEVAFWGKLGAFKSVDVHLFAGRVVAELDSYFFNLKQLVSPSVGLSSLFFEYRHFDDVLVDETGATCLVACSVDGSHEYIVECGSYDGGCSHKRLILRLLAVIASEIMDSCELKNLVPSIFESNEYLSSRAIGALIDVDDADIVDKIERRINFDAHYGEYVLLSESDKFVDDRMIRSTNFSQSYLGLGAAMERLAISRHDRHLVRHGILANKILIPGKRITPSKSPDMFRSLPVWL